MKHSNSTEGSKNEKVREDLRSHLTDGQRAEGWGFMLKEE